VPEIKIEDEKATATKNVEKTPKSTKKQEIVDKKQNEEKEPGMHFVLKKILNVALPGLLKEKKSEDKKERRGKKRSAVEWRRLFWALFNSKRKEKMR